MSPQATQRLSACVLTSRPARGAIFVAVALVFPSLPPAPSPPLRPFLPFRHVSFLFSLLSVRPACLSFRLCHLERCCHCPHCPGFSVMVNMQDYSSLFRHRLGASQFTSIIVTSYSGDESIIVFIFEMKKKNAF